MYTRSSSRRAFSCASRIASRYVIVIEPKDLRQGFGSRRDTKFRCWDPPRAHAGLQPPLLLPVVSRLFSSSRALTRPPSVFLADSFLLLSGSRGPVGFDKDSYPCRKRRHVRRDQLGGDRFRRPIADPARIGLALSRPRAPQGNRPDRWRRKSGLGRRSRWPDPPDHGRRIAGCWGWNTHIDYSRPPPPKAIFRPPPC